MPAATAGWYWAVASDAPALASVGGVEYSRHIDVARLLLDSVDPATHGRVFLQGDGAFGRQRHVRIAGDVGDGEVVAGQPRLVLQVRFHYRQAGAPQLLALLQIEGPAEQPHGARPRQSENSSFSDTASHCRMRVKVTVSSGIQVSPPYCRAR